MANNETGVIQPVAEAAALAREHGLSLHVDAVQAPGRLPVDFADARRRHAGLLGAQDGRPERRRRADRARRRQPAGAHHGRRAGAAPARRHRERRRHRRLRRRGRGGGARGRDGAARMAALRDRLEAGRHARRRRLLSSSAATRRASPTRRASRVPGKPAETLVIRLDLAGVAVSAGAACSSGKVGANGAGRAMGLGPDDRPLARSASASGRRRATTTSPPSSRLGTRLQAARRWPRKPTNCRTLKG